MLRHSLLSSLAQPVCLGVLGVVALSCSFYTDCPCANQPKGGAGTGAGTGGSAGSGTAGSGTMASGGFGNVGAEAGAGGESGNGGEHGMPEPAVWVEAVGNLSGRSSGCGNAGNVNFLSAKPDEDLVILSIFQDGLWGSRDGGLTWTALGAGKESALVSNTPTTIVYDPDHPKTFWESGIYGPGVYRTDDDGLNFQQLGMTTHNEYLSIDFQDADRHFMMMGGHEQGGTLYRSTDGGMNWDSIGDAVPGDCTQSTYPVVLDHDNYLLGCHDSIWATSDAGQTWSLSNSYGGATPPLITSTGTIYWTVQLNGGLVESDDNGQTWNRALGGGVLFSLTPIELPDGSLAAIGTQNAIMRSTDGGMGWTAVTPALSFTPSGLIYSAQEKAFFVWQAKCDTAVAKDAVLRYDIAF